MARHLLLLALLAAAPLGAQQRPKPDTVITRIYSAHPAISVPRPVSDSLEIYRVAMKWAVKEDSTVGWVSLRDTSFQQRFWRALGAQQDSTSLRVAIRVPGRQNWPSHAYLLEPRITAATTTLQVLLQQALGTVVRLGSKKDEARWFTRGFKLTPRPGQRALAHLQSRLLRHLVMRRNPSARESLRDVTAKVIPVARAGGITWGEVPND